MATKKMATKKASTALSKHASGELAEQLTRQSEEFTSSVIPTIKVKGRDFMLNDESLGTELNCVILESAFEHRWFASEYDPDIQQAPDCFALGTSNKTMAPHENSVNKQSDKCQTCEKNRFGSGRGNAKACQNRVRLMLLPDTDATVGRIEEAQAFQMNVAPSSLGSLNSYFNLLNTRHEVASSMVVTTLTAQVEGTYSLLDFEYKHPLPLTKTFADKLITKIKEARAALLTPYMVTTSVDTPAGKSKRGRKSKRNLS